MSAASVDRLRTETLRGDRAAARELLEHARRRDDVELELVARGCLPEAGGWSRILNLVGKGHGDVEALEAAFDTHWSDPQRVVTERELVQLSPDREPPRWLPLVRGLRSKMSVEQLGHALGHETLVARLRCLEVEADSWVFRQGQHSEYDAQLDYELAYQLSRALTTARPTAFSLTMRTRLGHAASGLPNGRALLEALASCPLTRLELCTPLGSDDLQRIAEAPWLGTLETLALIECEPGYRADALRETLPAVLAGLSAGLRTLRLGKLAMPPLGRLLATQPSLVGLEHLEVRGCVLAYEGAATLAGSTHLSALRTLEMPDSGLTHVDAQALLGESSQLQLEHLDLRNNQIASLDPDAFGERALSRLRHIDLRNNPLDEASIAALRAWRDTVTGKDEPERVHHARFGQGTVLAVREAIVEVAFDDGATRKLHRRFLQAASEPAQSAGDGIELLM